MITQVVGIWGLLAVGSLGQGLRYAPRQVPGSYGNANSTSSAANSTSSSQSSTSSSSSSASLAGYSSASPESSSTSSSSSTASATAYSTSSTSSASLYSSPTLFSYSPSLTSSSSRALSASTYSASLPPTYGSSSSGSQSSSASSGSASSSSSSAASPYQYGTSSSSSASSSPVETSYTTYTTLCTESANGTTYTTVHTHSAPIYSTPTVGPLSTGGSSLSVTVSTSIASPSGYTSTLFSYAPSGYSKSSYGPSPVGPGRPSGYSTTPTPPGYSHSTVGPSNRTTSYGPSASSYSPGVSVGPITTSSSAVCSGATLNVLGASLDWWYTETFTYVASIFSIQFNSNDSVTGWTLLPQSTTFDISSALSQSTCSGYYTTVPETSGNGSTTRYDYACAPTPPPVAASTTVISQTGFTTPNASTGTGQIPNVAITPAPAVYTIPSAGGNFSAGTPFVYFSAYEIMTKNPTTYGNGSVGCAETTSIYNMSSPFSFEYTGIDVNGELEVGTDVTGDVNPAFLGVVNETAAAAGSWVAAPTVVVVVEKVVGAVAVLAASTEQSATELQTPTPTLPTFLSPLPISNGGSPSVTASPVLESTQSFLELPTQSTVQTSEFKVTTAFRVWKTFFAVTQPHGTTTLILPTPTDVSVITTDIGGQEVTATAVGANQGSPGGAPPPNTQNNPGPQTTKPFVGNNEGSSVTLAIAVNPTQSVVTASFEGHTVVATVAPENNNNNNGGGSPPGLGGLASAIVSAAQPTNALQVLSEAMATHGNNPTAIAIVSGISGPPDQTPGSNGSPGSGSPGSGGQGPAPAPVFTVGGSTITANPSSGVVVAGQTLSPGGSAITVDGTQVSLAPGATAVVIGGSTSPLAVAAGQTPGAAATIPLITVGSQTFTANAATQFSLAPGATLTPGGQVVLSGTTISLAPAVTAVVINGRTSSLSPPFVTPAPMVTLAGTVYKPNMGSTYNIGGSILTPGGVITVSGSTISLASGATAVVVNGQTTTLNAAGTPAGSYPMITAPPVLTVDGTPYGGNAGTSYLISGQVLTPGGTIVITEPNGQVETISLNSAANALVTTIDGNVMTSMIGPVGAMSSGAPVLTIDGQTYTAVSYDSGSGPTYVVGGQTLTRGGTITISGPSGSETVVLDSAGTAIVEIANGQTTTSTISGAYGVMPTDAPVLTIGGATFTAMGSGATYIIDGQTLVPGGVETVTISGHTYIVSLSPQATILEVEEENGAGQVTATSFETLFPAQMTRGTVTNTMNVGVQATAGASFSAGGASPTGGANPGLMNAAPSNGLAISGLVIAAGSFVLAIWL